MVQFMKYTCAVLFYIYIMINALYISAAFFDCIYLFRLHFLHSVYIRHFNFPAVDW